MIYNICSNKKLGLDSFRIIQKCGELLWAYRNIFMLGLHSFLRDDCELHQRQHLSDLAGLGIEKA